MKKKFTLEERKLIQEGIESGLKGKEIAALLDRSPSSINQEMRRADRGKYNAEEIHNDTRNHAPKRYDKHQLDRISVLEMQMEIVIDQLNKITKG